MFGTLFVLHFFANRIFLQNRSTTVQENNHIQEILKNAKHHFSIIPEH